jgi:hypothetical protein
VRTRLDTRDADLSRWVEIGLSAPVSRRSAMRQLIAAARFRAHDGAGLPDPDRVVRRGPACQSGLFSAPGRGVAGAACRHGAASVGRPRPAARRRPMAVRHIRFDAQTKNAG